MAKATVIFADGSKQIAHDLDDRMFRWYEQKMAQTQEIARYYSKGIFVRDCSLPENYRQAILWREEVLHQQWALSQQIQVFKAEGERFYQIHGVQLRTSLLETQSQLRFLKRYIVTNNPVFGQDLTKEKTVPLKLRLIDAYEEIIRLQRLLIDQFMLPADVVIQNGDRSEDE